MKLSTETEELEILKPDGNSEKTKTTEGLNELLIEKEIDFSKVTEDVNNYFIIFQELSYNPGSSDGIKRN